MNRHHHHYLYLYLLLVLVLLLSTQAFSISESNIIPSLRPFHAERMLADITCRRGQCDGKRSIQLPADDDASFSIYIGNRTYFNLTIIPSNGDDLWVSINWDPDRDLYIILRSGTGFTQVFASLQKNSNTTVPGSLQNLVINLVNNDVQDSVVTLTFKSVINDSTGSTWINPIIGTAGALFAMVLIAMWCHRRRLNRQRRFAFQRRQIYQPVHIGSQPPSPRSAGNMEQEPQQHQQRQQQRQQQAVPQPPIEEVIDIRFAEAKFKQFKSSFPQKTCTICLEDMQEEQPCRQLDCQHIFHSECGKLWLQNQYKKMKKAFCPNCNKQMKMKVIIKKKKANK